MRWMTRLMVLLMAGLPLACNNGWSPWASQTPEGEAAQPQAENETASTPADASATQAQVQAESAELPVVVIETSMGEIVVELYETKAPRTVENFLTYVDESFYDGTIFHRVMPGFMIQGGGFTPDMKQKDTHGPIRNEADNGLKNERGTIAMARTGEPHSATSQFYINHVNNAGLNFRAKTQDAYGYCVFGRVVDGMDVVDAIARVKTAVRNGHPNVPLDPVRIKSIRRQARK